MHKENLWSQIKIILQLQISKDTTPRTIAKVHSWRIWSNKLSTNLFKSIKLQIDSNPIDFYQYKKENKTFNSEFKNILCPCKSIHSLHVKVLH